MTETQYVCMSFSKELWDEVKMLLRGIYGARCIWQMKRSINLKDKKQTAKIKQDDCLHKGGHRETTDYANLSNYC